MNIIDSINSRLEYKNMSQEEKINHIKNVFNLTHGTGKRKNKRKKGKKK